MPSGTITSATNASGHEANNAYRSYDWSWAVPLLNAGTNTLAIEVHQAGASSSDLVFDLALEVQRAWTKLPGGSQLPSGRDLVTDTQRGDVLTGSRTVDGGRNCTRQAIPARASIPPEITFVDPMHADRRAAGSSLATPTAAKLGGQTSGTTNPLTASVRRRADRFLLSPHRIPYPAARFYRTPTAARPGAHPTPGINADGGYVLARRAQHGGSRGPTTTRCTARDPLHQRRRSAWTLGEEGGGAGSRPRGRRRADRVPWAWDIPILPGGS